MINEIITQSYQVIHALDNEEWDMALELDYERLKELKKLKQSYHDNKKHISLETLKQLLFLNKTILSKLQRQYDTIKIDLSLVKDGQRAIKMYGENA